MVYEIITDLAVIVGLPVVRSVVGWAEKALADKKVTRFEKKQLLSTVIRVGAIGLVAYLGIDSLGYNVPALATAGAAYLADKFIPTKK